MVSHFCFCGHLDRMMELVFLFKENDGTIHCEEIYTFLFCVFFVERRYILLDKSILLNP